MIINFINSTALFFSLNIVIHFADYLYFCSSLSLSLVRSLVPKDDTLNYVIFMDMMFSVKLHFSCPSFAKRQLPNGQTKFGISESRLMPKVRGKHAVSYALPRVK